MIPLLAAVATMALIGGALLLLAGLRKAPVKTAPPRRRSTVRRYGDLLGADLRTRRLRVAGGVGFLIGLLLAVLQGWLVAIIIVPAAFVGIPMLVMTGEGKKSIERIEAMEEWTRSLAGVIGAGVGLEQAIQATLSRSTPEVIRPEVATLAARLNARWSTTAALRAFAEDLDDATGDAIVAGLLLAAERRGPGLSPMLEGIAERAAEDVRNRRKVEADLAKPRGTARWVTIITVVVLGGMVFNGSYIAPYGTPIGQMILMMLLSLYVGALLWMRQMSRGEQMPRFLGQGRAVARKATS